MASADILKVIGEAADRFKVSPALLASIAKRESSFDPNAKNPSSSASGLFQFLNGTWKDMMSRYGEKVGLPPDASPFDPKAAATMGAIYAKQNAIIFENMVGRAPSDGEIYAAHFLGPKGAVDLARAKDEKPDMAAALVFPAAAAVNHTIFFDKNGDPRSVRDVYASLTNMPAGETPPTTDAAKPAAEPAAQQQVPEFTPVQASIRPAVRRLDGPRDTGGETGLDRVAASVASRSRGLLG